MKIKININNQLKKSKLTNKICNNQIQRKMTKKIHKLIQNLMKKTIKIMFQNFKIIMNTD